jgi:uncharacterized membrane protein
MARTGCASWDRSTFQASVTIQRPVEWVFGFYRDFRNLPSILGDVMKIEQIGLGLTRWTIQGFLGIRAHWTIRVTEEYPNELIRYETISSPQMTTRWDIYFARGSELDETNVREVMRTPLGRVGRVALAVIGKFPAEEMSSNLHRLKQILETGRVTDTSYAAAGKFAEQPTQHDLKR